MLVLLLVSIVLYLHLERVTLLLGALLIHVVAIAGGTSKTDLNYYCNFAFFTLLDQGFIEVGLCILSYAAFATIIYGSGSNHRLRRLLRHLWFFFYKLDPTFLIVVLSSKSNGVSALATLLQWTITGVESLFLALRNILLIAVLVF